MFEVGFTYQTGWQVVEGSLGAPASLDYEICVAISLQIQQRAQITVIDGETSRSRDGWFCVKRDTRSGAKKHRYIVGAIADRHGLADGQTMGGTELMQAFELGFLPEDRLS